MPVVNLSDGRKLRFPDSMTRDQIADVLRNNPPPPMEKQEVQQMPMDEAPQPMQPAQPEIGASQDILQQIESAPEQQERILPQELEGPAEYGSGFMQGLANVLPGIANLGISAANLAPGTDIQKFKGFHFAPETTRAKIGEFASLFTPGALAKVPEVSNVLSQISKLTSKSPGAVKNVLEKMAPLAKGGLTGAVFTPEDQALGAAFGAGGAGLGELLGKGIPAGLSKLGMGKKPGRETIETLSLADVQPSVEAAERLGTSLRPSEASRNPFIAGQEGRFTRTAEAAYENVAQGMDRIKSEKQAISKLLDTIYDKSVVSDNKVRDLYKSAYRWNMKPEVVNKLKEDPLIEEAIRKVGRDKAWQRKMQGLPENNFAYLDKVRKELGDKEQKLIKQGEKSRAKEYTEARKSLVDTMDDSVPVYKKARNEAQRSIVRSNIQKKMREEEIRGSDFFNKIIKNDAEYQKTLQSLRNVPEAQDMLKDMKNAWHSLVNVEKPSTASYQSEKALNQARGSLQKIFEIYNQLFGKKKNLESVKFVRDMDQWTKELQTAKESRNKDLVQKTLTNILSKSGIIGAKESSEKEE